MNEIVSFINARLGDEIAAANAASDDEVDWIGDDADEHGAHGSGKFIRRHLPTRALRWVQSLRDIVNVEHVIETNGSGRPDSEYCRACHWDRGYNPQGFPMPCSTVRAIAAMWNDHPDYPLREPAPAPPTYDGPTTFGYSFAGPTWLDGDAGTQ